MRLVTQTDIAVFLAEKPAAAIHVDANWVRMRNIEPLIRSAMADAERVLAARVNFWRSRL